MPITVSTDVAESMPARRFTRTSKYDAILSPAAADGQPRKTTLQGATDDEAKAFARNLAHAANTAGHGIKTSLSNEEGVWVLFWQLGAKSKGAAAANGSTANGSKKGVRK